MKAGPLWQRRQLLKRLGLAGVGWALSACGGSNGKGGAVATETPTSPSTPSVTGSPSRVPTQTAAPTATTTLSAPATPTNTTAATATVSVSPTGTVVPPLCVLTPQQTEGPFFLDAELLRRDITEGKPGAPLRLALQVVDAGNDCAPVRDAVVEAWHTDAAGVYSGFDRSQGNSGDAAGETFLRGYQVTDANGRVEFVTIYPGWYPGRTVHVHVKILLAASRLLASQLYFPDSLTDRVYAQPPYDARGTRSTTNATDVIFRNGGANLILSVAGDGANGYVTSFVLGVAG